MGDDDVRRSGAVVVEVAFAIPLAALIVSMATLMFTALSTRTKASLTDVALLEARVKFLEDELDNCAKERVRLEHREVELMRMLVER